jgi:hypothetical protein
MVGKFILLADFIEFDIEESVMLSPLPIIL